VVLCRVIITPRASELPKRCSTSCPINQSCRIQRAGSQWIAAHPRGARATERPQKFVDVFCHGERQHRISIFQSNDRRHNLKEELAEKAQWAGPLCIVCPRPQRCIHPRLDKHSCIDVSWYDSSPSRMGRVQRSLERRATPTWESVRPRHLLQERLWHIHGHQRG
jgi:hypothetical protein